MVFTTSSNIDDFFGLIDGEGLISSSRWHSISSFFVYFGDNFRVNGVLRGVWSSHVFSFGCEPVSF